MTENSSRTQALEDFFQTKPHACYRYGKIALHSSHRTVTYDGRSVDLAPKNYYILLLFLQNPDRIWTHEAIVERLWEIEKIPTHSSVRSHIRNLRKAFKRVGATEDIIATIYGVGYRLNPAVCKRSTERKLLPVSILEHLLQAKSIEYLKVTYEGTIIDYSPGICNYSDYPEVLCPGKKIGEVGSRSLLHEEH